MFRLVASALIIICVVVAWVISSADKTDPAGNTAPSSEQVPAQPQEVRPKKPSFDTR